MFQIEPKETTLCKMDISVPRWRHNLIYNALDGNLAYGEGYITLTLPNGNIINSHSIDVARRLDYLLRQLSRNGFKESCVLKALGSETPLTLDELSKVKITITSEPLNLKSQISEVVVNVPNSAGVFLLRFPNGKCYVGGSKRMRDAIRKILNSLYGAAANNWQKQVLLDCGMISPLSIDVEFYRLNREQDRKEKIEELKTALPFGWIYKSEGENF